MPQTPFQDLVPVARWPLAVIMATLAAGFLPVASVYVKRYSVPIPSAVSIYLCFLLLCLYEIGLALPAGRFLFGKAMGDQQPPVRECILCCNAFAQEWGRVTRDPERERIEAN